jgi:hypothetical protein
VVAQPSLAQQLAGEILIQVEGNGEAWYVHPDERERYYLGTPQEAFNVMAQEAIGVSEADLSAAGGVGGTAPAALRGNFIIRPGANGEVHYVDPGDREISSVIAGPAGAASLINMVGLGVSNTDLNRIPVADDSMPVN